MHVISSNRKAGWGAVVLLACACRIAFGQNSEAAYRLDPRKKISQYSHEAWQYDDGLPQNGVQALAQTADGYLWIGLEEGLVRFDGVRFARFHAGNTAAITHNNVMALSADADGSLWIGTNGGGLVRLENGKFTPFNTQAGLSNSFIRTIHHDNKGNLWIGTNQGLNLYRDDKLMLYLAQHASAEQTITALQGDREGNLWIGTYGHGLYRLHNEDIAHFTTQNGLSHDVVMAIHQDQSGDLWIGTAGGLNCLRAGRFSSYTTRHGLGHDFVRSIFTDRAGSLWIGTQGGGLNRWREGKFENFSSKDGLSHDIVRALCEDREGSLWIGTYGGGLNRLRDGKFTNYTTSDGLSHNMVWCVYEDRAENLWFGTDRGLNRFKEGKFSIYSTTEGLAPNVVVAISEDRAGNLWIGTEGGGLHCMKDGKIKRYTTHGGLSNDFVRAIHEDRDRRLWVATDRGLNLLQEGKFRIFTTRDGLVNDELTQLYEDRSGSLWIASRTGGLTRLQNGAFTSFTKAQGLSSNLVRVLYEDDDATLWIGTNGGLNRFKDGKFTRYTTKEGLFDDLIFQILEDRQGNFWMSCNNGVFRVHKRQLEDFAQGKISALTCVAYGKADGMLTNECNGGLGQPSGYKARDGKLWFPTIRGVTMIDPEHVQINPLPPPVLIEQAVIDHRAFSFAPPLGRSWQIAPGSKAFELHYTGLSLLSPQKVQFKYKLEGFEDEWVDAGARRVAYYTNLPPGNYNFRVRACNNDGVWNEAGASLAFLLKPYFYQTTWFYALCAIAFVFGGASALRFRLSQIQVREQQRALQQANDALEARVQERTTELSRRSLELEESQTFLNSVIDNLPDMLFVKEAKNLSFVRFNRGGEEILGLSQKEMLGKTDYDFFPPAQADFFTSKDRAVLNSRKRIDISEEPIQSPKGPRWLYTRKVALLGADNQPKYLLGISQDITELKHAEEEIRQLNQELEERVEARTAELRESEQRYRLRTERIIAHQTALLELAQSDHSDFYAALKRITTTAAKTLGVERVSYWSFTEDRTSIVCENLFKLGENSDESGARLEARQFPRYFQAVEASRLIIANDARGDPSTGEFAETYLKPLDIYSMLDVPVWLRGKVVGVVCHEHTGSPREWTIEEQDFVASIADMISLALEIAERRRAERALRESEERLHQLAENINEVLWMESVDTNRLIYVSPIYEMVWGRSCESLLQQPSTFIDSVYPEDRERLRAHLSKQRRGEISETEYRIMRPDGTIRWIWDRGFPIQNGDGHIYRSAGLAQDITERKEAEEALHESEQRLREYTEQLEKLVDERASRIKELERQRAEGEKLAATGRMAARIAHEINNPLAGIKNSFLLIKDAIPSSHRYHSYVGRIEKEIDRITDIVRQMFILYRPDPVMTHSFRIDEMIEDVVSLLQTSCRENMVTLTTIKPGPPILVSKPEGLLRQVLYNVIQNAIEASPVQGKVAVELAVTEHNLMILVADQGSGIPEAIRSQIFEPFFTTKDNLLTPGIGLGLAISKSIIEVLRGTITFESDAVRGTVFKIKLPMED